jgi:non-heme chloroperoxidase
VAYVEVEEGVRIHAQIVGAGTPVVLLHGWAFDHRIWDRQIRVLTDAGHTAIAIDLRGHGRSDRPHQGYGLNRLARDVIAVIAQLDIEPAVLIGWSLGGVTALRVALDAPDRLTKLILVGSNGVATSRQQNYPFGVPASTHLPQLLDAELADRLGARRRLLRNAFAHPPEESVITHLLQQTLDTPSWAGAATLTTLLEANQVSDLHRLTVPTAQIIGDKDPVFSRRGAAWLTRQVNDLVQIVIPDCGHYPMIEAPDAFDEALLQLRVA